MTSPKAKSDFLRGDNGATPKLSKEQLGFLEDFGRLIRPSRRQYESADEFEKCLASAAEHLASVMEGKAKKVGKTTYKDLYTILDGIKVSGYFLGKGLNNKAASEETSDGNEDMAANEASKKDSPDGIGASKEGGKKGKLAQQNGSDNDHEKRDGGGNRRGERKQPRGNAGSKDERNFVEKGVSDLKINDEAKPRQQQQHEAPPQTMPEQHTQIMQQQHVYPHVPQHLHQATATMPPQAMAVPTAAGPGIDFFQESQIDMDTPHMDPAVVVVHHTAPPTQGQTVLAPQANQPPHVATTIQNQVWCRSATCNG